MKIVLILLLTVYSINAQIPIDTDGNGYINIKTLKDLRWISENENYWDENFELDNNIDASDTKNWYIINHDSDINTPDSALGFSPIGNETIPFTGKFNGKKYEIQNLYVLRRWGGTGAGLFGRIEKQAIIENVYLCNVDIIGSFSTAGIAGFNYGLVSNCYVVGRIEGTAGVGGIIGSNRGEVIKCGFTGDLICTAGFGGGIAGASYGGLSQSYSLVNIISNGINIGGLSGTNEGEITNCFTHSEISGGKYTGGFVGFNVGKITNSYCKSKIESEDEDTGGFFGKNYGDNELINIYWDLEVSKVKNSNGGKGRTTMEMKSKINYEEWDFESIWNIDPKLYDGYPYLQIPDLLTTVSVNEFELKTLNFIYPNPVKSEINLKLNFSDSNMEIQIFNLNGKLIFDQEYKSNTPLDLSHLKNGIYTIMVKDGNKYLIDRFIKE